MKFLNLGMVAIVSLWISLASADLIEGHLHRDSVGLSIHVAKDHKSYKLTSLTQDVSEILARMTSFDFIRGQGDIRNDQILLQTIDFIGLRKLLGNWSLSGGAYLTFQDFLNASYTIPDFLYPDKVEKYTYSLAPGEGKPWRILVSNGTWVSVGYLEIRLDKLKIQFVDLKTGQLKKPLELTRRAP